MAININNLQSGQTNQLGSAKQGNKLERSADNASDPKNSGIASNGPTRSGDEPVILTDDARQVTALQKQLIDAPSDNNNSKIAELKQAVADGTYKVDAESVAQKMSSLESQFNAKLFG